MKNKIDYCLDSAEFTTLDALQNSKNRSITIIQHNKDQKKYRTKAIINNQSDTKQKNDFNRILNTLISIGHPAMNRIYGYFCNAIMKSDQIGIISDFEPNGSLEDIVHLAKIGKAPKEWDATHKMMTFFGVAASLMYIHGCRLIHRNIKASNILFDENYEPKICDFNFSKVEVDLTDSLIFEEHTYTEIPYYDAPEILNLLPINNKVDVYSYGILLYLIFMNDLPKYGDMDDPDAVVASIVIGERPGLPKSIPEEYRKLISDCWANESSDRPSFKSIVRKLVESDFILPGTNIKKYESYMKRMIHSKYLLRKQRVPENQTSITLKEKADKGDAESQFLYAKMLETGKEITPDSKRAMIYYRRAADQNHLGALYLLGLKAENTQNWNDCHKFLTKAAENGSKEALFHLAILYQNGVGFEKDIVHAATLFKQAADQGDPEASMHYAEMLLAGNGVIPNKKLAYEYFKKAADQGDKDAQYHYGTYLYKDLKDDENAKHYFFKATEQYDINSMNSLADIYYLENDLKKAAYFYKMSYEQGDEIGKKRYLALIDKENISESDIEEAAKFFDTFLSHDSQVISEYISYEIEEEEGSPEFLKKKADHGNTEAQLEYAKLLMKGIPDQLEVNMKMAVTYLTMAAKQENPEAMLLFGEMLRDGIGIEKDVKKATKWLLRASDENVPQAMADYGYMRMKGIGFSHKNPEKAQKYLENAARLDNGDGKAFLAILIADKDPERSEQLINESVDKHNNSTGEYLLAMLNKKRGLEFMPLLKSSAKKGNYEAQFELAVLENDIKQIKLAADRNVEGACFKYATLINDENSAEALWYFTKAAESGDPAAEVEAAKLLVKSNPQKAESYLRNAMYKKYSLAFVEMGHLYKSREDYRNAAHMYHIGASLHNTKGMLHYGLMFMQGLGVNKNYSKAYKYLKMSADAGDSEGMLQFGLLTADDGVSINYLTIAAENGNNEARYYLAMSFKDEGKYAEAKKWLALAAKDGHEDSMFQLAVFYQNGYGTKPDNMMAAKYYKEAASLPNSKPASQFNYALMLKNGWGVSPNLGLAAKYFRLAALQGDAEAMNNYALILNSGQSGMKKNTVEAMKFFKMAADKGNVLAQNNYAVLLKNNSLANGADLKEALRYFKKASDKKNYNAINNYALMLKNGEGTKQNLSEAMRLFKIAADKGNNKSAMHNYSLIVRDEKKDFVTAAKYSKKAADLGELNAMNNFGVMLKQGVGIEKNEKLAVEYFKKAADKGNYNAMCNYATMLRDGCGIERNIGEAIKYYQMAIEKGSPNAMNCMALLYLTGNGVPKDKEKALQLSKQAMDKGNRSGMKNYLRLTTKKSNSLPY
ncbi:hypothetical protein TRFO_21077 [Tritrichomonas foetus]|uniref:Protein kinase domain-containing protein n=1 Tax=Tritrichomonas foetus TaxID=1144522 RepID=A0A1J4KEE9_9EUKA|nr:hypothetical protein TRFO_21077 [Tritrichomonas foetus]|eukprot:OHT09815.1 hypothetical protein TRFO_21077 [Tritrichomonas foetus]